MAVIRIFLIQHSESFKNTSNKFDSPEGSDDALTVFGIKQSLEIYNLLKSRDVDFSNCKIYTSSRKRSINTAKIIIDKADIQFEIRSQYNSINAGDLRGVPEDTAIKLYPDLMSNRLSFKKGTFNGYDLRFPNGDLIEEYENEVKQAVLKDIGEYITDKQKSVMDYDFIFIIHRSSIVAILNFLSKYYHLIDDNWYKYFETPKGIVYEVIAKPNNIKLNNLGGYDDWIQLI